MSNLQIDLTNLESVKNLHEQARAYLASKFLLDFAKYMMQDYIVNWHHELIAEYLQNVALGNIKKLMIFVPPQTGKSQLVSRFFPAFALGLNPKLKIVCSAYSDDLATSFNRDAQRIIDTKEYHNVFPETYLNSSNVVTASKGVALRNADIFETMNHYGFYKTVGVGGSLTGTPVDIGIIDDCVKDAVQATSPTYQRRVWEWYEQVFETRLHNDSKQIITMTRWDAGDLAGRILADKVKSKNWEILHLEGIKERVLHPKDPRQIGEALWESRHSKASMLEKSERTFNALYQQRPERGLRGLVFNKWHAISEKEYNDLPIDVIYGLDYGFSKDPLAFIECKIKENKLYCKEVVYNTNVTNTLLIDTLKTLEIDKNAYIYADSASPDRIAELQNGGFNAHPVKKGLIIEGISLMQGYEIYVCEGSENIANEFSQYKYKEDANGNPLASVVDSDNHAIDAIRYAVISTIRQEEVKPTENAYIARQKYNPFAKKRL